MILYGIKSILILSVLAISYKLLLEKETMHRFKRTYLLASLLLALVGPLLSFDVQVKFVPAAPPLFVPLFEHTSTNSSIDTLQTPMTDTWPDVLLLLYGIITSALIIRLVRNIVSITRRIRQYPTHRHAEAKVVLLPDGTQPHTFFHYLFVSQTDYEKQYIEQELFTHEITHIRQKHSLDILLVELISCFYWFNPALFFIRRAIRLNHEFLADESVNTLHRNIFSYQQLLLSKLTPTATIFLTSAFTFQTAKQRLIMMTKCTSPLRAGFSIGTTTALFLLLILTSGLQSVAQTSNPVSDKSSSATKRDISAQPDSENLEQRYGDKLVVTRPENSGSGPVKMIKKKFSELSAAEKKNVVLIQPMAAKTPTEKQFSDWKNPKLFGIWLDGKHIRNSDLNAYKPADIASFSGSYVHKNARQPQGYLYQFDLMTHKEYERYLKDEAESPFLFVAERKLKGQSGPENRKQ